jgi:SAM-dependent methyltransferase
MTIATGPNPSYVLGHSDEELQRLISQSRFFNDLTAGFLRQAGLEPGMRVLDVGCGAGDVSFLAADLVGPEGTVIGVDKSADAVAVATHRAAAAGRANVRFLTADIADPQLDLAQPVDALIGRLVLMYFADPAVVLRRLTGLLRPGGVVVFQDMDMEGAISMPPCPAFDTAVQRINTAFTRAGVDNRTGLKLSRIFQEAGLPAPQMILGARVESDPDSPIYDQVAQVTRSLLPVMRLAGPGAEAEIDVDTLAARIRDDATALGATLVSPSLIGAWTRK